MRTGIYVLAGFALALGLGFVAQHTQPGPQTPVHHSVLKSYTTQGNPTLDDLYQFVTDVANGVPPNPAFYTQENTHGTIDATLTGLTNLSGQKRCIVTIVDDTADLNSANLYVDGVLKSTATVANGRITDVGGGQSEALLPFWLPAHFPYEIKLHWNSTDPETFNERTQTYSWQ
jgi:hypothetical protein